MLYFFKVEGEGQFVGMVTITRVIEVDSGINSIKKFNEISERVLDDVYEICKQKNYLLDKSDLFISSINKL